jgi:hypothetical protein
MAKRKRQPVVRKTARRKTAGSRSQETAFPAKQWTMPAGFNADGSEHATLEEVLDPDVPTMQLSDLTLEQRAELTAKRLELQPKFELAMIGAGMVDKARAISEVKNKTKVGRLLIEIEHQMIRNLLEQAQKKTANYQRGTTATPKAKQRRKATTRRRKS